MWIDDIDSPQVLIGGGFRGVALEPLSQGHSISIQESFDNVRSLTFNFLCFC